MRYAFNAISRKALPAKREVFTLYNIIMDSHSAIITPFVPRIKITVIIDHGQHQTSVNLMEVSVFDPFDQPVHIPVKSILAMGENSMLSFYIDNCEVQKPHRVTITPKVPLAGFENLHFTIYYEEA